MKDYIRVPRSEYIAMIEQNACLKQLCKNYEEKERVLEERLAVVCELCKELDKQVEERMKSNE